MEWNQLRNKVRTEDIGEAQKENFKKSTFDVRGRKEVCWEAGSKVTKKEKLKVNKT